MEKEFKCNFCKDIEDYDMNGNLVECPMCKERELILNQDDIKRLSKDIMLHINYSIENGLKIHELEMFAIIINSSKINKLIEDDLIEMKGGKI